MGTFGNGVRVGIAVTETTGYCGAGLGTTVLPTCAWLAAAAAALRMLGTAATDFDVCQDPITPEPCAARAFTSDVGATFTTG